MTRFYLTTNKTALLFNLTVHLPFINLKPYLIMKNFLVLLLFAFAFNLAQASPLFNVPIDNYEKIVADQSVVSADFLVSDFNKVMLEKSFSKSISVKTLFNPSIDTTKFIKNGYEYMIIDYIPITEAVNDKDLDTTECYNRKSLEFMKTIKVLRKMPEKTNINGSSGGISAPN